MQIKLKPIGEQVVVVFGASSGIGRQNALDFAKRGAKVVVSARSIPGLNSLVEEIQAAGGRAIAVVADAADFDAVKNVADRAVERFGQLDTWVHSAATIIFGEFETIEPEEFKRVIEVNLLGQVYGAKAALPHLRERGGALIHITSVEAQRTVPYHTAYGSSKHGVSGFLESLRVELQHNKVPVSVTEIMPAAINTPIYDKGRNKLPFRVRAVPPYYHPRIVSDAILYAAENPIRDMVAGGFGVGVVMSERLSPRITDAVTHAIGFVGQRTNEAQPENQPDNLFGTASPELDTIEGRFANETFNSDSWTWLQTHPIARNALLVGAGAAIGFVALRALSGNGRRGSSSPENATIESRINYWRRQEAQKVQMLVEAEEKLE